MSIHDNHGIAIAPTDTVIVTSWGYGARLVDCGIRRPVIRLGRTRVTIDDCDGNPRTIAGCNLSVVRRDDGNGFEGNR